jgi:hypothetical protein
VVTSTLFLIRLTLSERGMNVTRIISFRRKFNYLTNWKKMNKLKAQARFSKPGFQASVKRI